MWRWMYDGNYGLINQLLVQAGLIKRFIPWLANSSTALAAIIIALIWQGFPFFAIMLLAGLQAIPQEMYEASAIDGAGPWQNFLMITLPLLRPVIFTTILLRTIWVANSLDVIVIMTGRGPGYSTYTLPVYSYAKAYKGMDFGYSSALAVLLTIFIMIFVSRGFYLYEQAFQTRMLGYSQAIGVFIFFIGIVGMFVIRRLTYRNYNM